MPIVQSTFRSPWWLKSAHLQTFLGMIARPSIRLDLTINYLELTDGDFLELAWVGHKGPIVLFFSGVEGTASLSTYARSILKNIAASGARAVFVHHRGCGERPNRLRRSYLAGDTEDLRSAINAVHAKHPDTPLYAVGVSLGANRLLKYLGEEGDSTPIKGAFAASVPFDFGSTISTLNNGFARVYQYLILGWLRSRLFTKLKQHDYSDVIDLTREEILSIRTLREFDQRVTLPISGLANISVDHYYDTASSKPYLQRISIPTVIIQARDDTFMTPDVIPKGHQLSACVRLELSRHGGHGGFVYGSLPWKLRYWLDERILDFLEVQEQAEWNLSLAGRRKNSVSHASNSGSENDPASVLPFPAQTTL